MTQYQNSKLSMYAVLVLFFNKYTSIFTAFTTLVTEIAAFKSNKLLLDTEISNQSTNNTGITADKNVLVVTAIELLVKFARKSRAWAFKTSNLTLEHLFDVRVTDFLSMPAGDALNALVAIRKGINDNITALESYNVLPVNVAAIDAAILAAKASVGMPKAASDAKGVSTVAIADYISLMDDQLYFMDDLLIPEYEGTSTANDTMVGIYKLGRELTPVGHSHSGVHVLCKDSISGDLLQDVKMEIVELGKSTLSTIEGIAEIIKCKPGTYHLKFSLVGYQDYVIVITINRGRIIDIQVHLVALAVI